MHSDTGDALIEDEDGESSGEEPPPASCWVLLKRNWAWRKLMSWNNVYLQPIESCNSKSTPETFATLSGVQVVVKPSPGCGRGAFAVSKILANQFVDIYVGDLMNKEECENGGDSAYLWEVSDEWYIDGGGSNYNWTRYMNHADESKANVEPFPYVDGHNVVHNVISADGVVRKVSMPNAPRVEMWTTREVQPGEELRFDYGEDYAQQLKEDLKLVGRELVE